MNGTGRTAAALPRPEGNAAEVFRAALRLGLTSFGGPIAHLGYFEREYVRRLRWLDAGHFAGLLALCQILPGPASSQLGFLIGWHRAGWRGALAAWVGFTLPSALLMFGFAWFGTHVHVAAMGALLHGLQLAAVAVVAQAVWRMALRFCRRAPEIAIALLALAALVWLHGFVAMLAVLAAGALAGGVRGGAGIAPGPAIPADVGRRTAMVALALFLVLLTGWPLLAAWHPHGELALLSVFYRAGALVFGGGHVVLPLLRDALVPHWMTDGTFLAGYGFAQALPGPLFTLAAYLGAVASPGHALPGAAAALITLFLPGLLIALAGQWTLARIGASPRARGALGGVNAAVVGLLAAALYDPVATTALHAPSDVMIALAALLLLEFARLPPVLMVAGCVLAALTVG